MKFSATTIDILKNFSEIKQGIVFKEGNVLSTITPFENILAKAKIEETIPKRFAIYDLHDFLNTLALFDDPEIIFDNDVFMVIKESGSSTKCRYHFSSEDIIVSPQKDIKMPDCEVRFVLEDYVLKKIKRASSTMSLPDFVIRNNDKDIVVTIVDNKDESSNSFDVVVGKTEHKFSFHMKAENLRLLPNDYGVEMSSKLITHFISKTGVEYWIALEKTSSFDE
jgi:hypothetical protein